jgi:ribosomal protein S18 acetylase RimI-like enzyme
MPQPSGAPKTEIRPADYERQLDEVRRLFQEYREWLSDHRDDSPSAASRVADGLASVDQQIADLPGAYSPPLGEVFLAFQSQELAACGALRRFEPGVGEIKRVFVRPDHRGPDFGRRLTGVMLRRARELGYERVRADTLPTMTAAIEYYQELGFKLIPAYWSHPVRGALFFECDLRVPGKAPMGSSDSDPQGFV